MANGTLVIATDSQVAISTLTNGHSQSSTLDKIVQRILKKLSSANVKLELKKIPTKKNPMDAPSRNKAMQWSTLLDHLTSFVREGSAERERGLTE